MARKAQKEVASRQLRMIKAAKPELTLAVKPTIKLKDIVELQEAIFDRLTGCRACLSGLERIVLDGSVFRR